MKTAKLFLLLGLISTNLLLCNEDKKPFLTNKQTLTTILCERLATPFLVSSTILMGTASIATLVSALTDPDNNKRATLHSASNSIALILRSFGTPIFMGTFAYTLVKMNELLVQQNKLQAKNLEASQTILKHLEKKEAEPTI
jgi:hypothetical protein